MDKELEQLLTRWLQPATLPARAYVLRVYPASASGWNRGGDRYCIETNGGEHQHWFGSWEAVGAYLQTELHATAAPVGVAG
jgi:hypothetical protein